jgi:hypothetical protein
MAKQVQIRKNEIPDGWSIEAADIINRVKIKNLSKILAFAKKTC